MKIYKYNPKDMSMVKISMIKFIFIFILTTFSISFISFKTGQMTVEKLDCENEKSYKDIQTSKFDYYPEIDGVWKDSVFRDYKERADLYLSRPIFKGTPLNGDILSLCARNAFDSTGILVPVELALSQAQWESSMGREGKSPVNNPFNIGENDSGTVKWFNSTFDGTQAYYYNICNNYLKCRSLDELFYNFVNCAGHRYASRDIYEEKVRNLYYSIKKWIDSYKN